MPKLDRIQLAPNDTVTAEHFNRLQENIERALGGVSSSFTKTLRILGVGGSNANTVGPFRFPLGRGDTYGWNDGVEHVALQWRIPSGEFDESLVFQLSCEGLSASGIAIARLRLGGGDRTATGTVMLAATIPASGSAFSPIIRSSLMPSPGGSQRLKLTLQSSGAGALAQIKDGYVGVASNGGA